MKPSKIYDSKTRLFRAKHEEKRRKQLDETLEVIKVELSNNGGILGLGQSNTKGANANRKEIMDLLNFRNILLENGFAKVYDYNIYYREIGNQFYVIRERENIFYHGFIDFIPPAKERTFKLKHKERFIAKRKENLINSISMDDAMLMDGILISISE